MSGLQDSHKFGIIAAVVAVMVVIWYYRQKQEQMITIPAARAADMPNMHAVSTGTGGGLAPADWSDVDYAAYQGSSAPCTTAQPFTH